MIKALKFVIQIIISLTLVGGLIYAVNSSTALTWLYKITIRIVPGTLHIDHLEGRLLGPIFIQDLTYQNEIINASINNIEFDWQPELLLKGKIIISKLHISEAKLQLLKTIPPKADSSPTDIFQITTWFNEHIKNVAFKNVTLLTPAGYGMLNGSITDNWDMSFEAQISDLKKIAPDMSGSFEIRGKIKGSRNLPMLDLNFNGKAFQFAKIKLAALQGSVISQIKPIKIQGQMQFQDFTSPTFNIKKLNVTLKANQSPQSFKTQLAMMPTTINYLFQNKIHQIPIVTSSLTTIMNQSGLNTDLVFILPQQQSLKAIVSLPGFTKLTLPSKSQKLKGKLQLALSNLNLIPIELPDVKNLHGNLSIDSSLSGTIAAPFVASEINLKNAGATLPALNIKLTDMAITAKGNIDKNNKGKISFIGQAKSGDGIVHLQGNSVLHETDYPSTMTLKGKEFLLSNTKEYKIYVSPDLTIKTNKNGSKITGTVFIPRATFSPNELKDQGLLTADDVVFIDHDHSPEEQVSFNVSSQIKLLFGDQITISSDGLQGRLTGALNINDNPQKLTTATGELNIIDGVYQAYGQKLIIRKGARLNFAGGLLTDPGMDIQAIRNITTALGDYNPSATPLTTTSGTTSLPSTSLLLSPSNQIVVGIHVQGTLKQQQLTLFSEPAILSQADILSYLLLGHSLKNASAADGQLLLQAAGNLTPGSHQLANITQQLAQTFSLDELGIQSISQITPGTTTVTQHPSLVLGKALSPRLYVQYSVGILEPINTLKISYILSSKWRLQTEANTLASGLDLLYTIERGK